MTWTKIDDGAPEHMKLREAGTSALALWVAALCFCNRNLTDGRVPKKLVADMWRPLAGKFTAKSEAARLVAAKLWHDVGEACGSTLCPANADVSAKLETIADAFVVHDFFLYQKSKAEVMTERKANANRQQRHRQRKLEEAATNGVSNDVTNGVSNTVSNEHPVPVPDPVPKDRERERPKRAEDVDPSDELTVTDLERLGFSKYGQLVGTSGIEVRRLCPVIGQEFLDAYGTRGESWAYFAKVVTSIRTKAKEPAPPHAAERNPRVGAHPGSPTQDFVDGIVRL